ncbi:TetR/AcrR family transcriptional regulator [Mycolicibacterium hodleri]|uniref:TetR/AcrR family transcriptional regulator n=1 Tax=Mycolicibacterium hodleri TaxID=49897 RepID=A0A502E6V9_9MYCO|nr:TetR/AcrR family transcriptional regulator [Mycolicibacterium hodleri]TPG33207.1 TetR/AcrR family transcriptional regulator [Mycolicibacterium hodleri]
MVISAVEVLRERGADAVTLDAVLTRSGAPRGSIYHHFPGGRSEILADALQFAGNAIAVLIERVAEAGAGRALGEFSDFWKKILEESNFTAGCPVVSVAVSNADDDGSHLTSQAGDIFERWCNAMRGALVRDGLSPSSADRLATMVVASVEGAVVLCRARRSSAPLDDVVRGLDLLIETEKFLARKSVQKRNRR